MNKPDVFQLIGLFFIGIYGTILIRKYPLYGIDSVIWYCDWVMLFSGVAFLFRLHTVLSSLFIQTIIVQAPWIIDHFLLSVFSISSMGLTDYMFTYELMDYVLGLRHYLVIPVFLVYFSNHKFSMSLRSHVVLFVISYVFVIGLSFALTKESTNTNCAYEACIPFFPEFSSVLGYQLFFIVLLAGLYAVLYALCSKYQLVNTFGAQMGVGVFSVLTLISLLRYAF